ncbi:hypothetical protein SAMN05421771_0871 [Granulicella pectinivorans]|uniref:DUF5666 domain-containing protein n=1 Tax=Granulicella pectinivorans TaxID=474950 RepID=A0A1I6LL08_9BACT|nr:hypothetical protein [Granulicella pectinivorans]SFS04174.1 hypothetical protein SAMN05421771_0871 [Granulicella pectinivorans]
MNVRIFAACALALCLSAPLHADNARFDLVGPKISIRVTRGGATLPIAEVPNLQAGDKLWIKAELPTTQSNHLLLIVAFLRGTTNEPPDNWFTEIDTWEKKTVEGTTITVPEGAEQAVLFVAPETGGDFKTLRGAVRGRPGVFIRADADLNQASFEQQRIERYLAAMKTISPTDPKAIQDHSAKLASTLALKPNADCFKQPVDQQVSCLTQSSAPVLLDDGHGQSIAAALSSGASSDFINAAAVTPMAGAGVYSAYVGAVVDLVKLTTSLRTAQYQYIPAISFPEGQTLNLKLNAPPSFINPKTVIVIGLPAIQKAIPPPLRAHDPDETACLLQPKMPLLLEGAPLVFSTSFAHDMVLHLNRSGSDTELALTPDAFEGGLVVGKEETRKGLVAVKLGEGKPAAKPDEKQGSPTDLTITGTVRGFWGFDTFEGPTLKLQQIDGKNWKIVSNTQLLAGQDNHLSLKGDGAACVQKIALTTDKDKDIDVTFKPAPSTENDKAQKDMLDLDVSLKKVQPGGYSLAIQQYGSPRKDKVPLTAYTGAIQLDDIKIHVGDKTTVLTGQGLSDVVSVQIAGQTFTPAGDGNDDKTIHLASKTAVTPEDGSDGIVKLKDGRTMIVNISAAAARPGLNLLSFKATPIPGAGLPITLAGKDELPLNSKLVFVVQTKDVFPRSQSIEIATVDNSVHTKLSLADNNLVLQDAHTAIGTLDPLKAFGQSGFGKLQMRPVAEDGTTGDWTPLGTLVRTPVISAVHCTTQDAPTCTADGQNFFLVQNFAANKDFAKPAEVPTGFADATFTVPTPADGTTLYFKLRDDPDAMATVTLPEPVPPAPAPAPAAPAPVADASKPVAPPSPTPADAKPATPPEASVPK